MKPIRLAFTIVTITLLGARSAGQGEMTSFLIRSGKFLNTREGGDATLQLIFTK